jgi:hypothetical protein
MKKCRNVDSVSNERIKLGKDGDGLEQDNRVAVGQALNVEYEEVTKS